MTLYPSILPLQAPALGLGPHLTYNLLISDYISRLKLGCFSNKISGSVFNILLLLLLSTSKTVHTFLSVLENLA